MRQENLFFFQNPVSQEQARHTFCFLTRQGLQAAVLRYSAFSPAMFFSGRVSYRTQTQTRLEMARDGSGSLACSVRLRFGRTLAFDKGHTIILMRHLVPRSVMLQIRPSDQRDNQMTFESRLIIHPIFSYLKLNGISLVRPHFIEND